jgi:tRNA dimethylallyltransferase
MNKKKPLIVITGATATGKSDLAIELAELMNGEIISADAMMVYKHMDIGTAKPSIKDRKKIKHYMIDIVEPNKDFSVKEFVDLADKYIEEIYKKDKQPIVVGGTWLYIQALLYGIADAPPSDWNLRKKLYTKSNQELYEELKKVDPNYSKKIHINDKKRIIRALEVFYLSGKPFSEWHKEKDYKERYNFIGFILEMEREKLMKKIEDRVNKMFELGLLDEVKNLINMGYEEFLTSKQAIGYKELIPYFKGEISLEEAKEKIIKNTKDFAKRQLRTFRKKFQNKNNWYFVKMD